MRKFDADGGEDRPTTNTRRRFLGGTAGTLGAVAVGSALTGSALAQDGNETDDDGEDVPDPAAGVEDEFEDDVDLLNYARELELLQVNFYEEALDAFDGDELIEAEPVSDVGDAVQDIVTNLEEIQAQEQDHADVLATTVLILDGELTDEPEFAFGEATEDPATFFQTAVEIEDTAVGAYAGAAPFIEEQDTILSPALSIHSVEARHAAYLRTLVGDVPFPNTYDEALARSEVESRIEEYLAE